MRFPFLIEPLMQAILIPFGAKPDTCYADLKNSSLTIKMGNLFEQTLDLNSIAKAERAEWPLYRGLGHRIWFGKRTGILASTRNVVCIHFKEPKPIKALFSLYTETTELYLSLESPDDFIHELNAVLDK